MTKRSEASRVRRAGRLVVRVVSTILTGAVAAALIALGSGAIANRAAETPAPEPVAAPFVATAPLARAHGYTVSRSFVGQVETAREIDVAFETGGTIEAITVEEGDRVSAGTVLARLDTRTLDAERTATLAGRAAVMAQLDLAERTAARAEGLGASGFASDQRVDEARATVAELNARVAEFDAAIAAIDVALDKAVLHAPFDGEIGPRSVDPGQTVAGGAPVVRLLEAAAPQLRVGLPPEITQRLTPGTAVTAEIDGVTYAATLVQVRPDLDPTTRTQAAIFDLDLAGNPSPAFGAAGRVLVEVDVPDPGAWVPLDALRAGIDGTWTLYTVSDAGRIVPEGVEILHTDGTRAFVRGGFADDTLLVTGGAHRLAPGEPVRIQE